MLKIFKAFLYFPSNRPRATFGMLLLVSATNFVEGISIGFLIPLLEAIDNQTDQQSSSKITFYLSNIFDFLNIPFELWTILVAGLLIYSLSILLKYFSETQMIKVSSIILKIFVTVTPGTCDCLITHILSSIIDETE